MEKDNEKKKFEYRGRKYTRAGSNWLDPDRLLVSDLLASKLSAEFGMAIPPPAPPPAPKAKRKKADPDAPKKPKAAKKEKVPKTAAAAE